MLKQRSAGEKANSHRARESCLAQELTLGDILKLRSRAKIQSWFNVLSEKFSSFYPVSTGNLSSPIQQNMQRIYSTEEQPLRKDGQGDKPKQSLTDSRGVNTQPVLFSVVGKRWKASSSGKAISSKDKATDNVSINI